MKKILILLSFITGVIGNSYAQRFAFVDSEYILKQIPDYNAAQRQVDNVSQTWQREVDSKLTEVEKMYKAYQSEQAMLSPEMRRDRENAIVNKEKEAKDFQRQKFGYQGELYNLRVSLIKPIQDKVAQVIQSMAQSDMLDVVFDKASQTTPVLYLDKRLDKSDVVLTKMGYKQ